MIYPKKLLSQNVPNKQVLLKEEEQKRRDMLKNLISSSLFEKSVKNTPAEVQKELRNIIANTGSMSVSSGPLGLSSNLFPANQEKAYNVERPKLIAGQKKFQKIGNQDARLQESPKHYLNKKGIITPNDQALLKMIQSNQEDYITANKASTELIMKSLANTNGEQASNNEVEIGNARKKTAEHPTEPVIVRHEEGNGVQSGVQSSHLLERKYDFFNEPDKWTQLIKYNEYLFNLDLRDKKKRVEEERASNNNILAGQIQEKKLLKVKEKEADLAYLEFLKKEEEIAQEKDRKNQEFIKEKKEIERRIREEGLKEAKEVKKRTELQNIKEDQYWAQKAKENKEAFEKDQYKSKLHNYDYSDEIKRKNLDKMKKSLAERESTKHIEQVMEDLDQKRQKENVREAEHIMSRYINNQQFVEGMSGALVDDKLKKERERNEKIKQEEKQLDLRARVHDFKIQKTKEELQREMREMLALQVKEKKERVSEEKHRFHDQGAIWKEDTEKYRQEEHMKAEVRKDMMMGYKHDLKNQIQDNKLLKEKRIGNGARELTINKHTLEEIEVIKSKVTQKFGY